MATPAYLDHPVCLGSELPLLYAWVSMCYEKFVSACRKSEELQKVDVKLVY